MSQMLREARKYEEIFEKNILKEDRPAFHLSARVGWMNDPNGFSYYNGRYHMFYQYYPYGSRWNNSMHWAHAVSDDLLHWEYLPVAMAPDELYDRDGCFSGSAVTLADGRQLLMYTGVARERLANNGIHEIQTQCIAVGDGMDYVKYENNPVIDASKLPDGCSRFDFRDPKIWRNEDGTLSCIVANRAADGSGQILLFTSTDGFEWDYKSIIASNKNRYGKMWECPDFFKLDDKWVMLLSPQDMLPRDFEYHNGNGTVCLIGDYDEQSCRFEEKKDQAIDYGIDFYAPQTILTHDGRRIMIGWMQNWDTCSIRAEEEPWFGQMSLPRELSIKNGRLFQWPVKEIELMRTDKVEYKNVLIEGEKHLDGVSGRRIDMELVIRPEEEKETFKKFSVRFAADDEFYTSLSFRPYESVLKIDRKFSGSRRAIIHQRRSKVNWDNKELRLRFIFDRFSAEVFVNGGEQVITATMYTHQEADNIIFVADGAVSIDVIKYNLFIEDSTV